MDPSLILNIIFERGDFGRYLKISSFYYIHFNINLFNIGTIFNFIPLNLYLIVSY